MEPIYQHARKMNFPQHPAWYAMKRCSTKVLLMRSQPRGSTQSTPKEERANNLPGRSYAQLAASGR